VPASLARRVMSLAYEALLLSAVLLAGTLPFVLLFRDADPIAARPLLQLYLVAIAGLYFGWQWLRRRADPADENMAAQARHTWRRPTHQGSCTTPDIV
jgi:type VI protein secretion system component VasK